MLDKEQIVHIEKRDLKDVLEILKAYKKTLDSGYVQIKRKKPQNSVLLSQLVIEIDRVEKLIVRLKNK